MNIIRPERNYLYYAAATPVLGATAGSSSWTVDELWIEPKEAEYLAYEEEVVQQYEQLHQSQQIDSATMDYARSQGVEHEWEMLQFFAQDDVNAPSEVFQYVDDNGNITTFTQQEIEAIREWETGDRYPIEGIEGHHIETVAQNTDNIELASDSNNILLATKQGHFEHLHGGNTKNPTQSMYEDVKLTNDERLHMTLDYNESQIVPSFLDGAAATMTSSVLVSITISQLITLYELKDDARPWVQKRVVMGESAITSALFGASAGAIAFTAYSGLDAIFESMSLPLVEQFMAESLALNGSILAVSIAVATFNYFRIRSKGMDAEKAMRRYKEEMVTAVAEFSVFALLGIGLEIGFDALGGLFVDALIPDPTGILIALRVGYSLFKIGSKMYDKKLHKEAFEKCIELRQTHIYNKALKPLV